MRTWLFFSVVLLVAVATACGDSADEGSTDTSAKCTTSGLPDPAGTWREQPPVTSRQLSMAPNGSYGALIQPIGADSLDEMAANYTAVVVTVLSYRDGSLGIPDEEWPWLPIFTACVERSTGTLVEEGEAITITQRTGGYRKGVAWDLAENALLEVGGRYLLFLTPQPDPTVVQAVQWGKWIIRDDGTLTRHWYSDSSHPYFAEVEGRGVDDIWSEMTAP